MTNLIPREPFDELRNFQKKLDNIFKDFSHSRAREQSVVPEVDVRETDSGFQLEASLPGISKDDVSVKVKDNYVLLSGERKEETEKDEEDYYHREISYGAFKRAIPLPAKIDSDSASASMEDGVLTVDVDRLEEDTSDTNEIEIE